MSDYEHIRCPQDIGFENIFPQEECEMRKFYGDCYHCWESSIAKRSQEIRADAIRKFAEWVDENYETEHYIPNLVEFYEKEQMKGENKMCNNECISKGKCEHNEKCCDDVCFTSEQSKVVEKLIAKAKENARRKFAEWLDKNGTMTLVWVTDTGVDCEEISTTIALQEYEKEQNNGRIRIL